ncbi:hypothetical protein HYFRA_00010895 [Hymenoscyphus fraxineus]|uniref:Uncharacterized protein n=1 Tax=Hymenoscyphus fraxineus TaxID=746836 RepID=A0A9N9KUX6_9HELO|nr:hypothetical protein HYFRA_00010895 [Hymenoscyphus fraxineus]
MRFQALAPLFLLMVLAHGKIPIMEDDHEEVICEEGECFSTPETTLALEVRVEYDDPFFSRTTYVPIQLDSVALSPNFPEPPIPFEDITPRSLTVIVTDHFFEWNGTSVANDDRRVLNMLERHGGSADENIGSFMKRALYCVVDTTEPLEGSNFFIVQRTAFGEPICQPSFQGAPLVLGNDTQFDGILCQITIGGGGCVNGFPVAL